MPNGRLILLGVMGLVLVLALFGRMQDQSSTTTTFPQSTTQQTGPAANPRSPTPQQTPRQTYAQESAEVCGFDYKDFGDATEAQHGCFEAKMEQRQAELAEYELRSNTGNGSSGGSGIFTFLIFGLIGFFIFRMLMNRQGGGGGGGAMSVGKSKAKKIESAKDVKTFEDVAGADEAKDAAQDFIDLLRNPRKYAGMGCKMPKGALLVGDPGNGKTLLAKAIAGEAGVPFFATSGSEFVEMFVGVGASRVRDLFENARKEAPCILFIDEIDAVGKQRGSGMNGGNDEREQTLNQLLVEMDGMGNDGEAPVIILAATNRPDTLDNALTRPGRFDKQIVVPNPDFNARMAIFGVHLRHKPVDPNLDFRILSGASAGMSGASIEAICNQAGILAVKRGKRQIDQTDIENAMEIMQMGAENRTLGMSDAEKEATAYHEAGHAVMQAHGIAEGFIRDKIYKATIVPRGRALGFVASRPDGDRVSMNFGEMKARIDMMLAGRIAEEIQYGFEGVTTGASNDYQQATKMTQNMVREGGYIEGLIGRFAEDQGAIFGMGGGSGGGSRLSEELLKRLEAEEQRIRDESFQRTWSLMQKGENGEPDGKLHAAWVAIANALLAHETLTGAQLMKLYADPTYDIASEFDEDHTVPNPPRVDGIPKVNRKSKGLPKIDRKEPELQEKPVTEDTVEDEAETPTETTEEESAPEGDGLTDEPEAEEQPAGRAPRDGGPKDDT